MIRKNLLTIAVVAAILFVMGVIAAFVVIVALTLEPAAEQIKQHGIKPGLERLWRGTNQ